MDAEDITATLLRDMFVKAIIGHAYRPIQKIIRFFPPDRRGDVKKVNQSKPIARAKKGCYIVE